MFTRMIKSISKGFTYRSGMDRTIFIYRYLLLIITSLFYSYSYWEHLLSKKYFVIGCLFIATVILSFLYPLYKDSRKSIKVLLIIEIIGNIILLIPTGGIMSPFIWYSLNTFLISSIYLTNLAFLMNVLAYCVGLYTIFGVNKRMNWTMPIRSEESYLLFSFFIIIICIQALGKLIRRISDESKALEETNMELENANKRILEGLDHTKALYQSVNILANQGNREGIIKLSFDHMRNITKTDMVFYLELDNKENRIFSLGDENPLDLIKDKLIGEIKSGIRYLEPKELSINKDKYIIMSVCSNYETFGILGFELLDIKNDIDYQNNIYQLKFLAELISIAFERLNLEVINERLLVTEEQNRIANEIHDSVLQRLFSMSCSIFSLIKKQGTYTQDEIENELNILRETTDEVMKDLRNTIYGLSWKKGGQSSFSQDVKRYIDDIKRLNNVNIPFTTLGNAEILSTHQKKAIYRIICESIGNAIRHGNSQNIEVALKITSTANELKIIDDGSGFQVNEIRKKNNGLGLSNIKQLVESLHGELRLNSKIGEGTTIEIVIPNFADTGRGMVL